MNRKPKTIAAVGAVALASAVGYAGGLLSADPDAALASETKQASGSAAPNADGRSMMAREHATMMREPAMRDMHRAMMREPAMRKMHQAMMRKHAQMMGEPAMRRMREDAMKQAPEMRRMMREHMAR